MGNYLIAGCSTQALVPAPSKDNPVTSGSIQTTGFGGDLNFILAPLITIKLTRQLDGTEIYNINILQGQVNYEFAVKLINGNFGLVNGIARGAIEVSTNILSIPSPNVCIQTPPPGSKIYEIRLIVLESSKGVNVGFLQGTEYIINIVLTSDNILSAFAALTIPRSNATIVGYNQFGRF